MAVGVGRNKYQEIEMTTTVLHGMRRSGELLLKAVAVQLFVAAYVFESIACQLWSQGGTTVPGLMGTTGAASAQGCRGRSKTPGDPVVSEPQRVNGAAPLA